MLAALAPWEKENTNPYYIASSSVFTATLYIISNTGTDQSVIGHYSLGLWPRP